jgi:serine/threonine-protein kinase
LLVVDLPPTDAPEPGPIEPAAAVHEAAETLAREDATVTSERDLAPPPPMPPRRRSRSSTIALVALLSVGAVVAADRFGYVHFRTVARGWFASRASKRATTVTAKPTETSSPAVLASASAAPSPRVIPLASASAQPVPELTSSIPSGMGLLKTSDLSGGRRIFVDDRTAGQTPESILVKCGTRSVKIGSSGRRQLVEVPCGGEIDVAER